MVEAIENLRFKGFLQTALKQEMRSMIAFLYPFTM